MATAVQEVVTNSNSNQWSNSSQATGGVKRKHSMMEEDDSNKWSERQSILNMSMIKLQPCGTGKGETSLRRSVLIFNTLKYLESELQQDCPYPIKPNVTIPARDVCLEPCHQDQFVALPKEKQKPEKTEKMEVKELAPLPVDQNSSSELYQHSQSSEQYNQSQTTPCYGQSQSSQPYVHSQNSSSFGQTQSAQSFGQTQNSQPYGQTQSTQSYGHNQNSPIYGENQTSFQYQSQSSEQLLQDTSYILDSLLASEKSSSVTSGYTPMIPCTPATEPMWEEPDNMWFSKYEEPFTNWLLNDDVDHIMQLLVSGSAG